MGDGVALWLGDIKEKRGKGEGICLGCPLDCADTGLCPLCQEYSEKLVYDHDHKTDRIKGKICQNCNSSLGFAKDNTDTLKRMIEYLK